MDHHYYIHYTLYYYIITCYFDNDVSIVTHYYICYYIIITYYCKSLLPIIMVIMNLLLPINTRSIIGNNGSIIIYYWPGQLGHVKPASLAGSDHYEIQDGSLVARAGPGWGGDLRLELGPDRWKKSWTTENWTTFIYSPSVAALFSLVNSLVKRNSWIDVYQCMISHLKS